MQSNFKFKPYLRKDTYDKYLNELTYIENKINELLKDYPNFLGIDFCDVGAGGIQIRGHHKEIKGYIFGDMPTIKYDFSNIEECIQEFVEMWKDCDNKKQVEEYKNFFEAGNKWGWD